MIQVQVVNSGKMHNGGSKFEAVISVAINVVPLIGCLYFDWKIFEVMFFYWLETSIALLFSLFSIFVTTKYEEMIGIKKGHWIERIIFSAAYGGFWLLPHIFIMALIGPFVFILFSPGSTLDYTPNSEIIDAFKNALSFIYITTGAYAVIFLYDIFSGKLRYGLKNHYLRNLYIRALVLTVTFLLSGVLIKLIGLPAVTAVLIMVLFRITLDLWFKGKTASQ